ncbi:hypothetical protein RQN9TF_12645 [Rhodococcus qingshengii]|uniref:hypothetical protein n=1 Tax=Rhodococcus TaxID=1827 RepID=UPI000F625E42|nr:MULTISPECIES: hypothetical protein [Rhodococcus]AZI61845.1 hypothetical protein EHW12_12205 [Rhodococcus sp. NJ-530]BDQ20053.1 hypothetical protein RQN9TF_12645 [Rhodococcus qingshengii]
MPNTPTESEFDKELDHIMGWCSGEYHSPCWYKDNVIDKGLSVEEEDDLVRTAVRRMFDKYTQAKECESLEDVTRFEVIDHRQCFWCRGRKTANVLQKNGNYKEKPCDKCGGSGMMGGRVYGAFSNAETSIIQIEQSFQDDGKTLKIFVKDKENL